MFFEVINFCSVVQLCPLLQLGRVEVRIKPKSGPTEGKITAAPPEKAARLLGLQRTQLVSVSFDMCG